MRAEGERNWRSRVVRVLLWVLALAGGVYAAAGTKPWQTGVARALAEKHPPALTESLPWGFWWGALTVFVTCGGLAATQRWWWRAAPTRLEVAGLNDRPMGRLWWWVVLGGLLAGTAVHRWPRMNHSFWGDESMAIASYVQDHYIVSNQDRWLEPLKLKKVPWSETFFGDRESGNNHYLFTVLCRVSLTQWRDWHDRKRHEFSEAAARAPAFIGGLALLVSVAWLGRLVAGPRVGLVAATLLAIHPWHLRYCTEARGYSLMGFFLCAALGVLVVALRTGTWAAWLGFAGCQFLAIYSCKIAVYPLILVNAMVAAGLWSMAGSQWRLRRDGLARWLVCNVLAATLFIVMYAPCHPQAVGGVAKIQKRGQTELSARWIMDMVAEIATGIPGRTTSPDSGVQVSWSKIIGGSAETHGVTGTVLGLAGAALLALALISGWIRLWHTARAVAWGALAFAGAAVLVVLHLKYNLKFEVLPWYFFFVAPALCFVAAVGAASWSKGWLATLVMPLTFAAALLPMNRLMVSQPYEDLRGAMMASRGRRESPLRKNSSRVYTCWLWRSSVLYDPRGNTQIRTLPMLNYAIRETERVRGELYMIIGYPELAAQLTPNVYTRVTSDPMFEKVAEFPAQVPRHMLTVYRYVPGGG